MPPVGMSFTYSVSLEGLVSVAGRTDNAEEAVGGAAVYNMEEDAFRTRHTCLNAFRVRDTASSSLSVHPAT